MRKRFLVYIVLIMCSLLIVGCVSSESNLSAWEVTSREVLTRLYSITAEEATNIMELTPEDLDELKKEGKSSYEAGIKKIEERYSGYFTEEEFMRLFMNRVLIDSIIKANRENVNLKLEDLELISIEEKDDEVLEVYKVKVGSFDAESEDKIEVFELEVDIKLINTSDTWVIDKLSVDHRELVKPH